jgi:8-oxo-dGTP pyrophosphatase MutT (NUDIX family)
MYRGEGNINVASRANRAIIARLNQGRGMSRDWKLLSTKEIFKTSFFRLRTDQCELPDGRVMPSYYALEFSEWANIVPVTEDNKIVLVEQYRHAIGETCLEIPGGTTTPGANESPEKAAVRELREETGYVPDEVRLLGVHQPNPAMQNNRMHTYIGFGCRLIEKTDPDPYEDITVVTFSIPEVIDMIFTGKIRHSIVIASLMYALPTLGFSLPRVSSR